MADEETERVNMVWPKSVKERVRDKVGNRGLTEFVLEAVDLHLVGDTAERLQLAGKETNELKWLVQQLADRVAMGGDSDVRLQGLMELELPSWIETAGWPKEAADRVRPDLAPKVKPEPDGTVVVSEVVPAKPIKEPEVKDSALVAATASEVKAVGDDMLAKVMAKAKEKGVDLASIDLKPASEVEAPEPKTPAPLPECVCGAVIDSEECRLRAHSSGPRLASEPLEEERFPEDGDLPGMIRIGERVFPDVEPVIEDPNADETEQLRAEAASAAGLCAKCGEELIDGECWTCD